MRQQAPAVRALVVDDSVVVRRTLSTVLGEAEDVEVVATAADGRTGLRRIAENRPDVVTLDIEMPGLSGIETLAQIRGAWPTLPVIMYSTLTERGARATLDALALGAVDYATKPSGAANRAAAADQVRTDLLPLVRLWGRRDARGHGLPAPSTPPAAQRSAGQPAVAASGPPQVVVLGVSTGGPDALSTLLAQLPGDLPVPVVVVQHMPPIFTAMLARRLDRVSPLRVVEAADGEPAEAGTVYVAAGGRHLELRRSPAGFCLAGTDAPPENSCRPAVDVLFRSAAAAARGRVLAAVLTGMGQDGLEGARLIRAAGGTVFAQDEASSVIWGMPGYVVRAGLAAEVLPLDDLAAAIVTGVTGRTGLTDAAVAASHVEAVTPCP